LNKKIMDMVKNGTPPAEAWINNLIDIARASDSHSLYLITEVFVKGVTCIKSENFSEILKSLCDLFALYHLENGLGEFCDGNYFTTNQIGMLRDQVRLLLAKVRPDAVAVVDAFHVGDRDTGALGRWDGQAYRALVEMAGREPLNQGNVFAEIWKKNSKL